MNLDNEYPSFSHLFYSIVFIVFNSIPCTEITIGMWCCGWWLIYVVDFWSLWWSSGLLVSSNSSILVAQVTTVQLVVEQWRLILVRPGWPGTPTNSWDILLICVVHTVLACQVRRLGIIGVAFPDHWPHCVTVQHLIPVSFPDHWPHCPRPSITANAVEGLVKLLRRMTSDGHLEMWLIMPCMHCSSPEMPHLQTSTWRHST